VKPKMRSVSAVRVGWLQNAKCSCVVGCSKLSLSVSTFKIGWVEKANWICVFEYE